MPVETRRQLAARYPTVVEAEPQVEGLPEVETRAPGADSLVEEEAPVQKSGWWEEDSDGMASGAGPEGRLRFSGKKGEGLTIKQLELMVKGSLLSRFKKLQKDVGEPVAGPEFLASYCIFPGEFLDNPAKLAHEREYGAHCKESDPVGALLRSLKRHFEDHKEGKAQEWVAFRREPGEELPSLLFRLQGLALDLEKPLKDKELVGKFVASLDRRLAEQTNTQAMASTVETGGAYSLEEAYDAALMVSAGNAHLKIARELAPRAAESSRPRWGTKPAGAHVAILQEVAPMVAVAQVTTAGSGACHNCGEVGHYRNTCPHPRRNSSCGRGTGAGAGGRGGGRGRACYVCGDPNHLAAQCAKRVGPVAAAVVAPQGGGGFSESEYVEFQAWKAMSQAAAAVEDTSEGSDWDDQEYELGAVAIPVGQGPAQKKAPAMAAAGTKAGAEKARATRAAKKQSQEPRVATGAGAQYSTAAPVVGTERIAGHMDPAALETLRGRRDKAAAKERLARLPDHGRNIAPQGLNRLPKGFPVGAVSGGGQQLAPGPRMAGFPTAQKGGAPTTTVDRGRPLLGMGQGGQALAPTNGGGNSTSLSSGAGPVLTGGVTISVIALLELAGQAGLDLPAVTAMAWGPEAEQAPVVRPIRLPAEGAAITRAGQQQLHGENVQAQQLSPAVRRAQVARDRNQGVAGMQAAGGVRQGAGGARGLSRVRPPSPMGAGDTSAEESGTQPGEGDTSAEESITGREDRHRQSAALVSARPGAERELVQPESSAMGTARGAVEADARMARALAAQESSEQVATMEERVKAVSRDAELAMQLIARDAQALGVDREMAMRAQEGSPATGRSQSAPEQVDAKKRHATPGTGVQEQALEWEKKLSAGHWRGSSQLAEVVVQSIVDVVAAAAVRAQAQALSCFAESRPLVQPAERESVEGVPD